MDVHGCSDAKSIDNAATFSSMDVPQDFLEVSNRAIF
jgi:hypothetical protein